MFELIFQSQPPLSVFIFATPLASVLYFKNSVRFWALFVNLFLRAFLWSDPLGDDEETYSIPVSTKMMFLPSTKV